MPGGNKKVTQMLLPGIKGLKVAIVKTFAPM